MLPRFDVLGIGLNATDTLLQVEQFPPFAGKVPFHDEILSPGGQIATAIVACARLGLRTRYIGTIGDDLRGDIQRQSLEGTGVDISRLVVRSGCPNQTAYIIIDGRTGERTVLWQRAECLRLHPSELREDDLADTRLLHLDGYDLDAAIFAATIARKYRIPVSLDVDTVYPGFERLLPMVDYLVAGSNWPLTWTGEPNPMRALARLSNEFGMRIASMTLGDEGALALRENDWFYSPAFSVACVDTTGAGDAFHGGFCYAMLQDMPLDQVLDFANATAALNCTALGARGHIPTLDQVATLLRAAETGSIKRRINESVAARVPGRAGAIP